MKITPKEEPEAKARGPEARKFFYIFAPHPVVVAQLVRASDCGSEGRGFEPHQPPESPGNAGVFCDYVPCLCIKES